MTLYHNSSQNCRPNLFSLDFLSSVFPYVGGQSQQHHDDYEKATYETRLISSRHNNRCYRSFDLEIGTDAWDRFV